MRHKRSCIVYRTGFHPGESMQRKANPENKPAFRVKYSY
jgi:hypothetical protein